MDRRKAMIAATGLAAAGGAGVAVLTTGFKPDFDPAKPPKKLNPNTGATAWKYGRLDPDKTAALAYDYYSEGSCMYGVYKSVVAQLADQFGEPYASFPCHMMIYGHGGAGGYGTLCGTLNGAAALIGLLVKEKKTQNDLITDLFRWYEKTPLPLFNPAKAVMDFLPPASTSESTLCHASTAKWSKTSGYRTASKERKERCRRLTADVAGQLVTILNAFFDNTYVTCLHDNETVRTCMTCHGSEGKVGNASGKMDCTSCHSKSPGHILFADAHYKFMEKK